MTQNQTGLWVIALCSVLAACGDDKVAPTDVSLELTPQTLDFGHVEVGGAASLELMVKNQGRVEATLDVELPEGVSVDLDDAVLARGESRSIAVTWTPGTEGLYGGRLALRAGSKVVAVALTGRAIRCPAPEACVRHAFDVATGACVPRELVHGEACETPCTVNGSCVAGACLGAARVCDDGNLCTTDSCIEGQGCAQEKALASCPQPESACQVAVCDAKAGCGLANVADNTSCVEGCTEGVCMAGTCEGGPRRCDDGNACTSDTCDADAGACVHADDSARCEVTNSECEVGVCDAIEGCQRVAVADGTACGVATCSEWPQCEAGICVARPAPPAGACGCDASPATPPGWSFGIEHTCRLRMDGRVECWGTNNAHQLGDGTTVPSYLPKLVVGVENVESLGLGGGRGGGCQVAAVTMDGGLYSWGCKLDGVVGDFAFTTPTREVGLGPVKRVGVYTSMCALAEAGDVYCRGPNREGVLGNGTRDPNYTWQQVMRIKPARDLSMGGNSVCALHEDGTLSCWGGNRNGALGNGDVDGLVHRPRTALTPSGVLRGVVEVSAGLVLTCVRTMFGEVLCAGASSSPEPTEQHLRPDAGPYFTPVGFPGCVTQLSAAGSTTCARLADGSVRCFSFSENPWGQLGTGSLGTPPGYWSNASGLSNVKEIRTVGTYTCASLEDGGFSCWGWNRDGLLGDGTTTDRYAP